MNEVLAAQKTLEEKYNVAADVWSVTSYKELRRDGLDVERWNMLHPTETPRVPYISQALADVSGIFIAASDYMKMLPDSIARWLPGPLTALGTDGFGRSDNRGALRDFFEVDSRHITLAALTSLAKQGDIDMDVVSGAMEDLEIDPEKANPMIS
jgi:pyruvate dehydrogenase E1 component